ncbi:MAG TPA: L,D-transpeptidase family protein [Puia sp.]|jgi:murein L,D-transpeptidase YcbB/YkuD|nr:L,D-transpeptidase family protein [Puia sp.]
MKQVSLIVTILFFLVGCSSVTNPNPHVSPTPYSDTSNPAARYTSLTIDTTTLSRFIKNEVHDPNDARRIRAFYAGRNFQFAWFDEQGLTEQGEAYWNLHQMLAAKLGDTSTFERELAMDMATLTDNEGSPLSRFEWPKTELRLTSGFFRYLNRLFDTKIRPEDMQWYIPRRKINPRAMLDSFLAGGRPELKPLNRFYYRLLDKMEQYIAIAKNGGWPSIPHAKKALSPGSTDPIITLIKRRLQITGDLDPTDTGPLFSDSLHAAVIRMQRSFGLKETGNIDDRLIRLLNVPVEQRIETMDINLYRTRWLPEESPDFLVANIPEFRLHVFENNKLAFSMRVVVGKTAHRTVIFSDSLKYIVFSPYWNVPPSIVRNEMLPAMKKDRSYLARHNLEITGYNNGLPVIRQKPGKDNSLGRVKFLFPNRYNIYFHDTPAKSLFEKETRAFSHGCVRLGDPVKLAVWLLRDDRSFTREKILAAMAQPKEKWVRLDHPIPVFIVYFTAWVTSDGLLNFRDDIYGHDKRMARHLYADK